MFETGRSKAETSPKALLAGRTDRASWVKEFAKEEDGVMTYFGFMMLFMMILVGGIGVDLMHNEMKRTRLQAVTDRAVLAAADLDQTLSPKAVVEDYFDKAGVGEYLSNVPDPQQGANFRIVTAEAKATSKTQFMRILGVPELPVPAKATAEERRGRVEVSMVLDISGSMAQNNKMLNLRNAAGTFIDVVLKPESRNLISVNLVPYSSQVNAGETIFDRTDTVRVHSFSNCIDFDAADFTSTALSLTTAYDQMQHFEAGWDYSYPIGNPTCPQQSYEEVFAFNQNPAELKSRIAQLLPRSNTAIHLGMKWGVAMLDPNFQSVTQELVLQNQADAAFSNRPASYSDGETLKTIILMTDGQNVDTYRIQPWYYANDDHETHWSRYPLFWYLDNYVSGYWNSWFYTKFNATQADNLLGSICQAAKDQGIIVWSVGFEVTDYSAGVMENCASSPSHFFRVEGVEITDAFEAIAKQINQLKLTQ